MAKRIPLVAEKPTIGCRQRCARPVDGEDIDKAIVFVGCIGGYADAQRKEEANCERPPKVPLLQTGYRLLAVARQHEERVFYLEADADGFAGLDGRGSTSVSRGYSWNMSSLASRLPYFSPIF